MTHRVIDIDEWEKDAILELDGRRIYFQFTGNDPTIEDCVIYLENRIDDMKEYRQKESEMSSCEPISAVFAKEKAKFVRAAKDQQALLQLERGLWKLIHQKVYAGETDMFFVFTGSIQDRSIDKQLFGCDVWSINIDSVREMLEEKFVPLGYRCSYEPTGDSQGGKALKIDWSR